MDFAGLRFDSLGRGGHLALCFANGGFRRRQNLATDHKLLHRRCNHPLTTRGGRIAHHHRDEPQMLPARC